MELQQLIIEALRQPSNAIPYYVSYHLDQAFPDQTIVETPDWDFDLHAYAEAGHCQMATLAAVHSQYVTSWNGSDRHLEKTALNAAYELTWQQHHLTILQLQWSAGWSSVRYFWLVAPRQAIADAFFHSVCDWNTEMRDEILVFDNGAWRKNNDLYQSIQSSTLDNLVLPGTLKTDIHQDLARFFESRQFYLQHGLAWKRGLLFIGPPGNGKTHMVKALINAFKLPCLYVKNFKDRANPETFNIRRAFEKARTMAPCILVLEDLDSLIGDESRSCFLNELDGFSVNEGILTLATTNHPERIDLALLERPSRFDRKYRFSLPNADERRVYLETWNQPLQVDMKLSAPAIAQLTVQTEGFSFAYLRELCLSSMMGWLETRQPGALDQVMIQQLPKLREQMEHLPAAAQADIVQTSTQTSTQGEMPSSPGPLA